MREKRNAQITFIIILSLISLLCSLFRSLFAFCEFCKCSSELRLLTHWLIVQVEWMNECMAELEYKSVSVCGYITLNVFNCIKWAFSLSHTCMILFMTISHWIKMMMFGSSAICTSKSFDSTCDATQTTQSSDRFRFEFHSNRFFLLF